MSDKTTGAPPSPARVFRTMHAYQQAAAMRAAVQLDVFSAIGAGARTASEIAAKTGAAERGVRILCDTLVVIGFLKKDAKGYTLEPDAAAFLDKRSPAYLGAAVEFIQSETLLAAFRELPAAVRKGGTALPDGGSVAPDHPMWADFARSMAGFMSLGARLLAEQVTAPDGPPLRVLDVAAGHGMYGITIAARNRKAEVVALDWPHVLEVAMEFAARAGVAKRVRALPGSAFDVDFGKDYDVVLFTNFFHHFDVPACETLARKAHAALRKGGRAVTLDFVPNDDRVTPPEAAGFALTMLATTPSGDAYTFKEYERIFRAAGYARSEMMDLPPTPHRVIVAYV
jgi:ubiquinone/menaquinone biosynthesis C-methylase UbiE